jgi:branched-chain amino acid transport system ATP-binding protein
MLAIGRALVINPKLLLLDEPLEGLAPIIVEELLRVVASLTRDQGLSTIVVEQHPQAILAISDKAVVMDQGRIAHASPAVELLRSPQLLEDLIGLGRAASEPAR